MIEHDRRIGKIARQPRRCGELLPARLQLEVQAERREPRIARAPALIVHLPRPRLGAHAADKWVLGLRREHGGAIVAVEPRLRNRHRRQPVLCANGGDEGHLTRRIARVPFRLDMHGALDVPTLRIGAVVGRQIGSAQRAVVAVAEGNRLGIAEPRVVMRARIPEVQMRIGDEKRVQSNFPVTGVSGKLL